MGIDNTKLNPKRVIILAGAVIAFTIGSGFATGQEIIQYFTAYGVGGIGAVLVFLVTFLYYNFNFAKAGSEERFERGNDVYKYFCGKYVGTFCDYYSTLFCYMSFFVMVGGSASTLNQQSGLGSSPIEKLRIRLYNSLLLKIIPTFCLVEHSFCLSTFQLCSY